MDSNYVEDAGQRRVRGRSFRLFGVTEEEFVTQFAQFLEFSVERGDCEIFRASMDDMGETEEVSRVRSDPNSALAKRIMAANEALEVIEVEFGKGAVLKLDHPFNQTLIRNGRIAPDRIEAAMRRMTLSEPT